MLHHPLHDKDRESYPNRYPGSAKHCLGYIDDTRQSVSVQQITYTVGESDSGDQKHYYTDRYIAGVMTKSESDRKENEYFYDK
jgi:hypothetical protein